VTIGCDDQVLARKFLREMNQYLIDADIQDRVWHRRPHIEGVMVPTSNRRMSRAERDMFSEAIAQRTIWTQDQIQLIRPIIMKEASVTVTSVQTNPTGDHYDCLDLDDIVNKDNSDTKAKRNKIDEWAKELVNVLDPISMQQVTEPNETFPYGFREFVGGEITIQGTFWFKDDYYQGLLKRIQKGTTKYKIFCKNIHNNGRPLEQIPGDPSEGYIFPERFTHEHIEEVKADLATEQGSLRRFNAQYLLIVTSDEEKSLQMDHVNTLANHAVKIIGDGSCQVVKDTEIMTVRPILVVDPAISLKDRADFTSIGVVGMDSYGDLLYLDGVKKKMLPAQSIEALYDLADKWHLTRVYIEGGMGFQDSLIISLRAEFKTRRPLWVERYVPKGDKKTRIENVMQPIFNNRKFWCFEWLKAHFDEEVEFFPSESVNDDCLDMLSVAAMHLRPAPASRKPGSVDPGRHVTLNSRYGGCR
jgi:phage terminase large subunit-like protein